MTTSTQSQEVINFGKFKGTALEDLPYSYTRWLLAQETLNASLRKKLEAIEARRERAYQNRKAVAIYLADPRNQRTRYSANQRIAYNNAKYN